MDLRAAAKLQQVRFSAAFCIRPMRPLLLLFTLLIALPASAQQPPFASYTAFKDSLLALTGIADAPAREARLTSFFDALRAEGQVPYKQGDHVAFLYRGPATSVAVAGDHNGWDPSRGAATRLGASDVWIQEMTLPPDARVDYKIVRNGTWILDPANPRRQQSGFGPNSALWMPEYRPSPYVARGPDVPQGALTANRSLVSAALGFAVNYRVYTPPGYDTLKHLPVVYATDGQEYVDAQLGSLPIIADNLFAESRMRPVLIVFIDPRVGGTNRRESLYIDNAAFATFVAQELVPSIDAAYRTDARRAARAILGTSLGGVFSAYVGLQAPETFGLLAVQSPAFWYRDAFLVERYKNASSKDLNVFMTWGTLNDGAPLASAMVSLMREKGLTVETRETNEGHSWGQWSNLLDDILLYFFPRT